MNNVKVHLLLNSSLLLLRILSIPNKESHRPFQHRGWKLSIVQRSFVISEMESLPNITQCLSALYKACLCLWGLGLDFPVILLVLMQTVYNLCLELILVDNSCTDSSLSQLRDHWYCCLSPGHRASPPWRTWLKHSFSAGVVSFLERLFSLDR